MKRFILTCTAFCLMLVIQAQTNAIDDMFNKYSEREGFTLVSISSKMLNLFAGKGDKNEDGADILRRLKSIRILTVEDSLLNRNLNFYNELSKKMDFSVYEELLVVREGGSTTKFLIRQNGNIITELLVIAGGPNDNAIISIKGDLDLKSLSDLSKNTGIEELKNLENIDKKNPKK